MCQSQTDLIAIKFKHQLMHSLLNLIKFKIYIKITLIFSYKFRSLNMTIITEPSFFYYYYACSITTSNTTCSVVASYYLWLLSFYVYKLMILLRISLYFIVCQSLCSP